MQKWTKLFENELKFVKENKRFKLSKIRPKDCNPNLCV